MIFAALERQTMKNFEVLVSDDGSNEETRLLTNDLIASASFPCRYLWHEDRGFRKNIMLNKAIVNSRSDYLIFLDGDCIPHRKWIQEHYENRLRGRIIAGRRVQLPLGISENLNVKDVADGRLEKRILPLLIAGVLGKERHVEDCIRITGKYVRKWLVKDKAKGLLGCNFSMFKEDILKVNGFDERFVLPALGEDTDLEARLGRIGIFPLTKKHLLTVYHKKHFRKENENDSNFLLYAENNKYDISWTPYGIVKGQPEENGGQHPGFAE